MARPRVRLREYPWRCISWRIRGVVREASPFSQLLPSEPAPPRSFPPERETFSSSNLRMPSVMECENAWVEAHLSVSLARFVTVFSHFGFETGKSAVEYPASMSLAWTLAKWNEE